MDKLKSLNVAGKMSDTFGKLKKQPMLLFFIILIVLLVVIALLVAGYLYLLKQSDADIIWLPEAHNLRSTNKNKVPASSLPSVNSGTYTLSTWFAIEKNHYLQDKELPPYSHLISYGHTRTAPEDKYDSLACGVWLNNKTNNLLVVYRTEDDDAQNIFYNPNHEHFNSPHKIELKNFLLNEWNLLTLVANNTSFMVFLNGELHKTEIHSGAVYYDDNWPLLDLVVGDDKNIYGIQKNIRFKDVSMQPEDIAKLYFGGPTKFKLPDFRDKEYTSAMTTPDIFGNVGSKHANFLDKGANVVDSALGGMTTFFNSF